MFTTEFLITLLIIVMLRGTGAIYTSSTGLFAGTVRNYVINSPRILNHLQRSFGVVCAALGARLAMAGR